jgi:hypothetical protein
MRTHGLWILGCLLGGCLATATTEPAPVDEPVPDPAIENPSCATTHADFSATGGIDPAIDVADRWAAGYCDRRGAGYCGCTDLQQFQGAVVDLLDLAPEYVTTLPGASGSMRVEWADAIPNEQVACESLEVIASFYRLVEDRWELQHDVRARGSWEVGGFFDGCTVPGATFTGGENDGPGLEVGSSYRIALTAVGKPPGDDNFTRFKAVVITRRPIVIH